MPQAVHPLEDPLGIRCAGREVLSLALLDARNQLLARLARLAGLAGPANVAHPARMADQASTENPAPQPSAAVLRLAVQAGWYQEHWISCHVQRGRGEACDPGGVRLAGLQPAVLQWLQGPPASPQRLPTQGEVHAYLAQTLEVTLELLAGTADEDAALYFYRQSLLHEDRLCEAFDEMHQLGSPPARVMREPLWMPAQTWRLGCTEPAPPGWVPFAERGALDKKLPEFEIDAQPVNWAQFVEFVQDQGYDRPELWTEAGWAWVQGLGRRSPAHVAQLRGAVVVQRGPGDGANRLQRAPPGQAVMHVSQHEAQAWCRWAGRRLATEAEWEVAACTASSRGFVWGDVLEWTTGSARLWPGAGSPPPGSLDAAPVPGEGVLRGGSFATRARWRHPKARRFASQDSDTMFCGFRSCAF